LTRSIAIVRGVSLEEASRLVLDDDLSEVIADLADIPMRFNYRASPTLDDIETSMDAYWHLYGVFPELVIVDNVTDVFSGGGDEDPFSGLESLCNYLSGMARETEACVVGLHHVTGQYNDADKPIPLSGVKGQISRVPSMILTLHKKSGEDWSDDMLCVSPVKNRGGKADPSGYDFAELLFSGAKMEIRDLSVPGL